MLSNLPIAKCRENYIINTNYFSIPALIILVGDGSWGQQKTLPARRSRVTHMKFREKLLQEKAMAETMWDNKVTINPDTNQYHLVVFLVLRQASYNHLLTPYDITRAIL